ncbi:MAG TPA: hypothetical protein VFU73_14650 [Actinocrinis sp.]|nr:hypothetical protein [Actinocrinis sp.]
MDPTGFILGVRAAERDAHSARPDAPVIPDKPRRPRRPPRVSSVRRATATSLRGLAAWIEPHHESEPCSPAIP